MQYQRWIVLTFIVTAVLVGWTVQSASVSGFGQFAIPDTRLGPVTLSTVLALVAGTITFFALLRREDAVQFTDEVVAELGLDRPARPAGVPELGEGAGAGGGGGHGVWDSMGGLRLAA